MLFPKAWGELGDAGSRVLADTLQDIDEVGVEVDRVQATSDDQALHDADVLGTEFGPTEIPIFAP